MVWRAGSMLSLNNNLLGGAIPPGITAMVQLTRLGCRAQPVCNPRTLPFRVTVLLLFFAFQVDHFRVFVTVRLLTQIPGHDGFSTLRTYSDGPGDHGVHCAQVRLCPRTRRHFLVTYNRFSSLQCSNPTSKPECIMICALSSYPLYRNPDLRVRLG